VLTSLEEEKLSLDTIDKAPKIARDLLMGGLSRKYPFLMYALFKDTHRGECFQIPADKEYPDMLLLNNGKLCLRVGDQTTLWCIADEKLALEFSEGNVAISQDHKFLFHISSTTVQRITVYSLETMQIMQTSESNAHCDVFIYDPKSNTAIAYPQNELQLSRYTLFEKLYPLVESAAPNAYFLVRGNSIAYLKKFLLHKSICSLVLSDLKISVNNDQSKAFIKAGNCTMCVDLLAGNLLVISDCHPSPYTDCKVVTTFRETAKRRGILFHELEKLSQIFSPNAFVSSSDLQFLEPFSILRGIYGSIETIKLNNQGTMAVLVLIRDDHRYYYLYDITTQRYTLIERTLLGMHYNFFGKDFHEDIKFDDEDTLSIANNCIYESFNRIFRLDFSKIVPEITFSQLFSFIKTYRAPHFNENLKNLAMPYAQKFSTKTSPYTLNQSSYTVPPGSLPAPADLTEFIHWQYEPLSDSSATDGQ
jgi:hypothetical protein